MIIHKNLITGNGTLNEVEKHIQYSPLLLIIFPHRKRHDIPYKLCFLKPVEVLGSKTRIVKKYIHSVTSRNSSS
jgi:hypothetical protein